MADDRFSRYEDARIHFEYPNGYRVTPTSDPGRFHYGIARRNAPTPTVVIDVILKKSDAEAVRTSLEAFKPLNMPTIRQVVHRRGPIGSPRFRGLEVWTSTEQVPAGDRRTSEWTVLMDFGSVWVDFEVLCEGVLDQTIWTHVLHSISVRGAC